MGRILKRKFSEINNYLNNFVNFFIPKHYSLQRMNKLCSTDNTGLQT